MGGEVLELLHERAARLEREAEERGIEQGKGQGIEQAIAELSMQLRERGVDDDLIADVVSSAMARMQPDANAKAEQD